MWLRQNRSRSEDNSNCYGPASVVEYGAKIVAKDFGYTYLDTGAMYRAATYI